MKPEDPLDLLFKSQPIEVDTDFTRATMERIRAAGAAPGAESPSRRARYAWFIGSGLVAATVAVLLGLGFLLSNSPTHPPAGEDIAAGSSELAMEAHPAPRAPASSSSAPEFSTEELYTLAQSMEGLDVLMEEDNLTVLTLLASDLNS